MTGTRPLILAGMLLAACLLLPVLTVLMIPDRVIERFVVRSLASRGVTLQAERLGTAVPLGLKGSGLAIGDGNATYLTIDRASVRLRLLPLLTGTVAASLEGRIGAGTIGGSVTLYPSPGGNLQVSGLQLAELPVLTRTIEGSITGTLQLDAEFKGASGEAKLRISSLGLSKAKLAAMPLPDLTVPDTRGLLKLSGSTVSIASLAMQGEGIYLRLTGSLPLAPSAPLALNLELLPTAELLERQKSVFLLMFPYLTSPGRYTLPIGGTLASPQLTPRGATTTPPPPAPPAP
ncbi:type II secretion system protein GspN [Trichlorobacter ammonificans]|uniref:Type II secretion system protein GspN n=1 Tax=Trichlorobacter ammonificans TaxID=2916410 RepID=A0ABN8HJ06_9BACT|nr:type II secretion system protein GspN [Trichlorobacter ammonificans]CAH2031553.1 conserved protein of unknown function [Trichlorobacter ammonificans]